MIVPMKKVTLFALHAEQENALNALRDLGVMQIVLDSRLSEDSVSAGDRLHNCQRVLQMLEQTAAEKKISAASDVSGSADELISEVDSVTERSNQLASAAVELRRRLEFLAVWGDFDRAMLDKLEENGIRVVLCSGGNDDFRRAQELEAVQCYEISRVKGKVAFAVVGIGEFDDTSLPVVKLAADDDPKAELRADMLDAVQQRLEFLAHLGSLDREPNKQENALLKSLAGISTRLNEALKLLNNPAFTPDDTELERLSTLVDAGLDEQEELLSSFHSSMEK